MGEVFHGGRLVAEVLAREGVTHLFTLTGGHIAPIFDGCLDVGIRVVDVRHEQAAAHMADGWARVTGKPGVCAVTAGPGVTDAVTGIANAYYACAPVVVLAGRSPISTWEMGDLQEMDHTRLTACITRWSGTVLETKRIPEYVAAAFRQATSLRGGPVLLELPMDVLLGQAELEVPIGYRPTHRPGPDPDAVDAAAAILAGSERVAILAGGGVRWSGAETELAHLAETLRCPVYLNGLGRGCLPPDNPYFFNLTRKRALGEAEVLLALGVDFDFRLGYGRRGFNPELKVIQVDVDPAAIGKNRPVELGVVADLKLFLRALLERAGKFGRVAEPVWTDSLRQEEGRLREERERAASTDQVPIHPLRFAKEVRDFLDPDAIVVGDGGDIVAITSGFVHARAPGHWLDPGPMGCLGVGAPFAIAAKLAKPEKQVVVVFGDGSFGLNAMEYDTAVRHRIPFIGVIGNDGAWGQIKVLQKALYGEERMPAAFLGQRPYEKLVEALGGYGERVEEPSQIRPALERAAESGVPACINVILDPRFERKSTTAYGF